MSASVSSQPSISWRASASLGSTTSMRAPISSASRATASSDIDWVAVSISPICMSTRIRSPAGWPSRSARSCTVTPRGTRTRPSTEMSELASMVGAPMASNSSRRRPPRRFLGRPRPPKRLPPGRPKPPPGPPGRPPKPGRPPPPPGPPGRPPPPPDRRDRRDGRRRRRDGRRRRAHPAGCRSLLDGRHRRPGRRGGPGRAGHRACRAGRGRRDGPGPCRAGRRRAGPGAGPCRDARHPEEPGGRPAAAGGRHGRSGGPRRERLAVTADRPRTRGERPDTGRQRPRPGRKRTDPGGQRLAVTADRPRTRGKGTDTRRQRPRPGRKRTGPGRERPAVTADGPRLAGPWLPRPALAGLARTRLTRAWLPGSALAGARLGGPCLAGPGLPRTRAWPARAWPDGAGWALAPLARPCAGRASPWSCRAAFAGRPPPADARSLSATSWVTVEEWLLASTPMEDSLASRSLDGTPSSLAISYTRGLLNQISLPRHRSSGAPAGRRDRSTFGSAVPRRRRWPPPCRSPSGLVGCCAAAPPCPGRRAARTDRRHGRPPCRSGRRRPSRQANARSGGGYASRSSNGIPHTSAAAFP